MRESKGKATGREIFYRECLPGWLSPEAISAAHFLTLLSHPARELPLIDALHVPRRNVMSIERDPKIFALQREARLGVSLYRGDAATFLRSVFLLENRYQVLNLDIEGSYRTGLDPGMGSVLLFSWKNEHTVVGTYSSISRDRGTLYEGLLSLTLFAAIAEDETLDFLSRMSARYTAGGYTEPVGMVLRDLFWLRSILEHALVVGHQVGVTDDTAAVKFSVRRQLLWAELCGTNGSNHGAISLGRILDMVRGRAFDLAPCLYLELSALRNLVYRAVPPWSERCYFMKVSRLKDPLGLRAWLTKAMREFLASPLVYVDRFGKRHDIGETPCQPLTLRRLVWSSGCLGTSFEPRKLQLEPCSGYLARAARNLRTRLEMERSKPKALPAGKETEPMAKPITPKKAPDKPNGSASTDESRWPINFMRRGKLTESGREVIRTLAREGMCTQDIAELIPRTVPNRTITAVIAATTRRDPAPATMS